MLKRLFLHYLLLKRLIIIMTERSGIYVRYGLTGLKTDKRMCGEVLGTFEIDGGYGKPARRITIDLLMTRGKPVDVATVENKEY